MQSRMQGWFAGPSSKEQDKAGGSLLADWNSYAASKESEEGTLGNAAMDLENGLTSASTTLVGAFNS